MDVNFVNIPEIISDFRNAEDKGDVEAVNINLKDLYNEMEHDLHFICNEVSSDRLDYFKNRYFSKRIE
ncbi:hypothetical protein [Candidatus Enterococcus lemimoniae]|uniref:Uncharacterized protein n=1 Tax=Candidatus Enterococcus lemimoniae TaxID=1834167 RepID=A0ABZ2T103_9ENTE|nr:hypothetical protein [Enterococcus sp. 12C11_DIV0727]OTO69745.1 hypothetical protein A5866_001961 [Enterococcus sp. 12C11_DIV0727]